MDLDTEKFLSTFFGNIVKFAFEEMDSTRIEKEIHNLKTNKAFQSSDILNENVDCMLLSCHVRISE